MKIVVIGGTGLIGASVVKRLRVRGHDVLAASPSTGVDSVTGRGLAEALAAAEVVIDVANSPSFDEAAAVAFFQTAGTNLLKAEAAAGVRHHIALSVVGTDRLQARGYFRAKLVQEKLIEDSNIPYTLVRATQFFEFASAIAKAAEVGDQVRLPSAAMQPIAADDVADAMVDAALAPPIDGIVEVAGPEAIPMATFAQRYLRALGDPREVIVDNRAGYFDLTVDDTSLMPGAGARLMPTRFDTWLAQRRKAA